MSYDVQRKLGQGAFGSVYSVRFPDGNTFAVKIAQIIVHDAVDPSVEAATLRKLNHPHIVQCFGFFVKNRTLFVIMELCKQGTLRDFLNKRISAPLPEDRICLWFVQFAHALQYIHSMHVYHRDLKPENILLDNDSDIKLTDFGVARYMSYTNQRVETQAGTACYMSPEVLSGQLYTGNADVWSMACCIHELMTRKITFPECRHDRVPPLPKDYSNNLRDLVLSMLIIDPRRRLGNPGTVLKALESIRGRRFMPKAHRRQPDVQVNEERLLIALRNFQSNQGGEGIDALPVLGAIGVGLAALFGAALVGARR